MRVFLKTIVLSFLNLAFFASYAQTLSEQIAATAINLWKPGRPAGWSYEPAVVLNGMQALYQRTGKEVYLEYIKQNLDYFVSDGGTIKTYKPADYNIDNILGGRNLLLLYKTTKDPKYLEAATVLRNQLRSHPRTHEGGFWHKKKYDWQMWLDGLYMGQPFYAEYAALTKEDSVFDDVARQFILMERHARDEKTGLLYHGYDESRQQQWADKTTGRSPEVWGRAMGWYGMALVDALEWFPDHHPKKDSVVQILNRFAKAVARYQDRKTGLWWDIIDKGGKKKNYHEASASSMFVYALLKGVRLGYLDAGYISVAQQGYKSLVRKFINTEDGQVNLYGTVKVSGLGGSPYRDGTYDYYMNEPVVVNDPKGVGAFILAGNEIDLLPCMEAK